ncbi:MAG: hypothetical protein ACRDPE_11005 [Solirubrobacterales bacterium]
MRWRAVLGAVCVAGVVVAAFFVGRSSVGESATTVVRESPVPASTTAFATLPTVKCHTLVGISRPAAALAARTQVAIPPSLAKGLSAYRDRAGTMIIAPSGWDCEAGIGVDGSEHVTAFPKGEVNPGEEAEAHGDVVQLNIASACQGCQAEALCTLFPEAAPVAAYYEGIAGQECPEKPLHEEVSYPTSETAMFTDPPGVEGSGAGSGGPDPSLGALSYTEPFGVHKVSCTLPKGEGEVCAAIVAAALLAAPAVG